MRRVDSITFNLGDYEGAFEAAIEKAKNDKLVERMHKRDHTLWSPDPTEIANRLGWMDVARRMREELPALQSFAKEVEASGITQALLLGMGGSSLAPELFSEIFGSKQGIRLSVLDSTDPDAIRAAAAAHDPKKTLYIVSSKSGGTVETFSFFKYFFNQAQDVLGADVGAHFVAITDPGSGLAKTAEQHSFRKVWLADPNIGGRYSALSHFGLVPAALLGVELDELLTSAERATQACQQEIEGNPGALLGLALGMLAEHGRDKLTFRTPPRLASFADWAEQLIAESTGKLGKGILPVAGEPELSKYGKDRVFVSFGLAATNEPNISVELNNDAKIGAQFFTWEFATAVAGYVLGINPFDQPDVEAAKVQARQVVEAFRKEGQLPKSDASELSAKNLEGFLAASKAGDYIALQAYAAPTDELTAALTELRTKVANKFGLATTLGYGPRFLHSTGQLHKGDAGNGLFVQFITDPPATDLPIPNDAGSDQSDLSFGVLKLAQALGDAQALRAAGRRVLSFKLAGNPAPALSAVTSELA
jgi:transaldolase/glucose-6-phosphate isomerase